MRLVLALAGLATAGALAVIDRRRPLDPAGVIQFGERVDYHYRASAAFALALLLAAIAWPWVRRGWARLDGAFRYVAPATDRGRWVHLLAISVLGLYLEIMLIRYLAVEVRIFAYFKNMALLAGFFGLGLGSLRAAHPARLLHIPVCLTAVVLLAQTSFLFPGASIPQLSFSLTPVTDILVGSAESGLGEHLLALACLAVVFAALTWSFVPIGQVIGQRIRDGDPVKAYSLNVAGSLLGIALFTGLSWAGVAPLGWFAVALGLLGLILPRGRLVNLSLVVAALVILGAVGWSSPRPANIRWSPYHKVTWQAITHRWPAGIGQDVKINQAIFQRPVDLREEFLRTLPAEAGVALERLPYNRYNVPYRIQPRPADVLIVGAGTGNDVAAAVRNGAGSVVAVEIDPALVQLGREIHPEAPYAQPRVEAVVDDARAYMNRSTRRFDLIVFATLDSHTLASGFTNIQLDHYVYTLESFQAARRLLKPGGVLCMPYDFSRPWLLERFRALLTEAFQRPPRVFFAEKAAPWQWSKWVYVAGAPEALANAAARDPVLARLLETELPAGDPAAAERPLPRDAWPYVYLEEQAVPALYYEISLLIVLVFGLLAGRPAALRGLSPHFFFLGAAFLLLEFQGLSRLALLFGTTWMVSSVVIAGILLMILAANLLVLRLRPTRTWPAYAGLGVALAASYLVSPDLVGGLGGKLLATFVTVLPLFFAGLIFAVSFRRCQDRAACFAANLIGAVLGGLLESSAFVVGIPPVLFLAGGLYLLSFWTREA